MASISLPSNILPTILPLLLYISPSFISAETVEFRSCPVEDALTCARNGYCTAGDKDYRGLLGTGSASDVGLVETSRRGMHCTCPDDSAKVLSGFTGVQCETPFERCGDNSICFNGGYCVRDSYDYDRYHCACPKGELDGDIYTGRACESKATDICHDSTLGGALYDVAGSKWFCTNGGQCTDYKICDCPYGFAGPHCEYEEFEYEECLLTCYNGGTCKKGAKDLTVFTQSGMDIDAFLGGSNLEGEHCACPDGFTGLQCNITDVAHCGGGVCFNGGVCIEQVRENGIFVDFVCECDSFNTMLGGAFCEHRDVVFCPAPVNHDTTMYYCANGGECPIGELDGPCTNCNMGWTGPRCETMIYYEEPLYTVEETCDLNCRNGGVCFFSHGLFEYSTLLDQVSPGLEFLLDNKHCKCPTGYVGLRCELKAVPRVDSLHNIVNPTSDGVSISKSVITFASTIILGIMLAIL